MSSVDTVKSLWLKAELALLRRHQHDSRRLRAIFAERYDIHVGMQSYGCFDRWRMRGPMTVGRYCSIASTARSALDNHPYDAMTTHPALYERKFGVIDADRLWEGSLTIEDDVWIGHYAMLLPGCKRIGRGAIIGAGAVVTRSVEPYTIVAGSPARALRKRFEPDLIAALERSEWWKLDPPALRELVRTDPDLVYHPTAAAVQAWTARGA